MASPPLKFLPLEKDRKANGGKPYDLGAAALMPKLKDNEVLACSIAVKNLRLGSNMIICSGVKDPNFDNIVKVVHEAAKEVGDPGITYYSDEVGIHGFIIMEDKKKKAERKEDKEKKAERKEEEEEKAGERKVEEEKGKPEEKSKRKMKKDSVFGSMKDFPRSFKTEWYGKLESEETEEIQKKRFKKDKIARHEEIQAELAKKTCSDRLKNTSPFPRKEEKNKSVFPQKNK